MEFNRVNGMLMQQCLCKGLVPALIIGNLALSRALGDFEFKNNKDLRAEDQIVTGIMGSILISSQSASSNF